jgi:hypothetical protein
MIWLSVAALLAALGAAIALWPGPFKPVQLPEARLRAAWCLMGFCFALLGLSSVVGNLTSLQPETIRILINLLAIFAGFIMICIGAFASRDHLRKLQSKSRIGLLSDHSPDSTQ